MLAFPNVSICFPVSDGVLAASFGSKLVRAARLRQHLQPHLVAEPGPQKPKPQPMRHRVFLMVFDGF